MSKHSQRSQALFNCNKPKNSCSKGCHWDWAGDNGPFQYIKIRSFPHGDSACPRTPPIAIFDVSAPAS